MVCMSKLSILHVFSILKQFTHCLLKVKFSLLFCLFFVYLVFWPWRKGYEMLIPRPGPPQLKCQSQPLNHREFPSLLFKKKPPLGGVEAGKQGHTHTHTNVPLNYRLTLTPHFDDIHWVWPTFVYITELIEQNSPQLLSNDHHKKCKSQCGNSNFV